MANAFIDGLYTTSAKVFLMKTGQVKDLSNENNFHPNANVNGLFVHIEDGVSTNIVTVNFAPSKKPNWATHDFPLLYIDTIEHTIVGELTPRTFARYFNYIPSQLLAMNLNSSTIMDVGVTVKQQSGANVLGAFNTLADLQSEYNNQEVLEGFDEDNTIAYVYEVGENGYYMVDYNSISGLYEWVLKTNDYSTYLSTKPYNMFTIKVQRGYQNTKPITTLEDEQYRLLWAYMGSFAGLIEAIGNRVTTLEEEMDLVEERLDVVEPIVEQHGHELEVVKQSDWDFYDLVSDEIDFANSRNCWVQVGSDIYVFGGIQMRGTSFSPIFAYQYGNRAFKYNLVTKTWTRLENQPAWFNEQRAVHKDGYIYLFGGNGIVQDPAVTPPTGYNFLTNKTYRYDIANDEYTLMAESPIIICLTSGAILIDSKVYVIVDAQITSGAQQFLANSKVYVYDITANTWEAKASTNTVFDRGYAVYYDGLIYVQRSLKFQAYNPTTDTWITNLTPPTYGVVHTGLPQVYNGRLIIGSGWESSQSKNNPFIQYYDVVEDKWFVSTRLELDYQPLGYGTLAMYDNKLFYFGGYHNEVISISNKYIQTFNLERMRCAEVDDVKANLEAYKVVTNGRLDDVEDDITDILDGAQTVKKAQQDASGNVITTTYETKADATSKKSEIDGRLDTAESEITKIKDGTTIVKKAEQDKNGNDIVNTYETKIDATSKLATKVDKTQKIIGLDLQDDILLGEFKTALGNATQSVAGLLSAEDKTHLDNLVALLESSDGDTIVDTIGEILAIFNNYPEGADLVTALNGKVDKVAGKGLSQNDFTDALKNKLDGLLNGSQYYDKDYIDALKDQNGWESELLTLTPLTPSQTIATATLLLYNTLKLQVKNTSTSFVDTDSVEVSLGVVTGNKILLNGTDVYLEIGATNSTFVAPAGWQLQIVGLKYTELKASDTTYDNTTSGMTATTVQDAIDEVEARVDDLETFKNTTVPATYETKVDVTSKLALKADVAVVNEMNREQDHRISTIEEAYRKSQNGELTATKQDIENISLGKDVAPAPLQVKVDGGLLEAKQLLFNPNIPNLVGWSSPNGTLSLSNGELTITGNGLVTNMRIVNFNDSIVGDKYYGRVEVKVTYNDNAQVYWNEPFYNPSYFTVPTINTFTVHSYVGTAVYSKWYYQQNFTSNTLQGANSFTIRKPVHINVSKLIANKTYSPLYNKTFDTMSDAEIKAQMDLWVQNGTLPNDNVLAVGMNKRVRSVGKNVFDGVLIKGQSLGADGLLTSSAIRVSSLNYTNVQGSTAYRLTNFDTLSGTKVFIVVQYDKNNVVLDRNISVTTSFTTLPNARKIRFTFYDGGLVQDYSNATQFQLELGSTATSYVPYANTDLYLQANKVGYKLPNGVADTIEYRNGKYYFVQRVQKYVLQSADIDVLNTSLSTNFDVLEVSNSRLTDAFERALWMNTYRGIVIIAGWVEKAYVDDISTVGSFYLSNNKPIKFKVSKGTYANLSSAQTALAGTVIYYQLATPIETEILAFGNAQGLAGGTVYIDDVMADSNLYTSKYDIENTAYPIKSLDRIVKINADGSQTELAVSSATVAGDGLSFTHPSLVANDIVWVSYAYNVANLFKSNTFVTYYDNPFIAVQPNGTPRRITFSVDNSGVVTVSSQAV